MAARHASIPGIRAWNGVREFGLRVVFLLLATWPFMTRPRRRGKHSGEWIFPACVLVQEARSFATSSPSSARCSPTAGTAPGNVHKERNNLHNIRDLINKSKDDIISKLG